MPCRNRQLPTVQFDLFRPSSPQPVCGELPILPKSTIRHTQVAPEASLDKISGLGYSALKPD